MNPICCLSIHGSSVASSLFEEKEKEKEKKAKVKAKKEENQSRDQTFILNQIKSCIKEKNLWKLRRIHAHMNRNRLFPHDVYIATSLVNAYAKCGSLSEAQDVFQKLPTRNVVSWNALISGYTQQGLGEIALKCFKEMKDEGISPDSITYLCMFKACGTLGSLDIGEIIEAEVRKQGLLRKDVLLGNSLIDMYMKCGALEKAQEVFEEVPSRDTVTWTTLIAGYAQHRYGHKALNCFRKMQDEGVSPNVVTYIVVLKACGIVRSLEVGEDIHAEVEKRGLLPKYMMLSTSLVDMYAKCCALEKAREVFEQISMRNVVCWNALISGYAQNGFGDEAVKCFKKMQDEGISPNVVTYICILKVCGFAVSLDVGRDLHAEIRKQGLMQKDVVLGTTLIDMYAKYGMLGQARETFEELPIQTIMSWNALMSGYVQNGYGFEALTCFRNMKVAGFAADRMTYICILKACGIIGSLDIGEDIVVEIRKQGLLQNDVVLGNALVDMFAKCGELSKAREAFEQLSVKNIVSWTVLIAGYAQHKCGDEALKCFKQMQIDGFSPDAVTYICILKVCAFLGSLEIGEDIDVEIRKQGLLEKDAVLGATLIDMYAKCGALHKAREVFDQLPTQNLAAWTALIAGYAQNRLGDEALQCFKQMQDKGVMPDLVTYTCVLKVCGIVGSLSIGEDIFVDVRKKELFQNDVMLGNTLVGMYAKCGALNKAREVFEQLPVQDIVSWNALIAGYGQLGQANIALNLFVKMRTEGIIPDWVTFLVLLMGCGHAGLIKIGEKLFNDMRVIFCFTPALEHYTCMIDLFGRAGHFDKAILLLDKVSSSNDFPLFVSILCACHKWGNVKLGRWALEQLAQLDEKYATLFFMENTDSTVCTQTKVDEVNAWTSEDGRLGNVRNWIDANIIF